jgi:hypothetical protein
VPTIPRTRARGDARPVAGPVPRTPLGLMTLFVTFSETVLGVVATQTTGAVQMLLAVFVVTFPVLIAAGFFVILWHRPHHLYHPSEYGAGTTAEDFERATRPRPSDLSTVMDLLRNTIDVLDGDKAKALVIAIPAAFAALETIGPFITAQYDGEIRAGDGDGTKARRALKRLVSLTVHGTEDIKTWQGAIAAL